MSAARDILDLARQHGVIIEARGERLRLRAPQEPPREVLDAVRVHKPELLVLLSESHDAWSAEDWRVFYDERAGIAEFDGGMSRTAAENSAYESCITEWLNRNQPVTTDASRCAWCRHADEHGAVIMPFRTERGGHTWLHPACWRPWMDFMRSQAQADLARFSIHPPDEDC